MRKIAEGPDSAKIMAVGEAPGGEEDKTGKPFQGAAGQLLNTMLMKVGISRPDVYVTNVAHERPPANDFKAFVKPLHPQMALWLTMLKMDIERVKPNLVVALGNYPLQFLTGKSGIGAWRGSILDCRLVPGVKVIPTYHPASIFRQWSNHPVSMIDWRRIAEDQHFPEHRWPKRRIHLNPPKEQWPVIAARLMLAKHISFDIECETREGKWQLYCVSIADSPDEGFVWQTYGNAKPQLVETEGARDPKILWEAQGEYKGSDSLAPLKQILESPNEKIAQNGQFDVGFLETYGINVCNFSFDTMYAQHCCYPEFDKGLDFLASIYTREPYYKDERKTVGKDLWRSLVYCGKDSTVEYECFLALSKELTELHVWDIFKHEMSLVKPLSAMTKRGVLVDVATKKALGEKYAAERDTFQAILDKVVGRSVNVSSPKQVAQLLYGDLRLPLRKKRGSDSPSTDEDTLVELSGRTGNQVLRTIIEIRRRRKILGTYIGLPVDADGRIRSEFKPAGTNTGRLSSSASIFGTGTNFQNVPESIREFFVADDGRVFIYADLSQAEARCVAWFAGDERLKELFRTEGIDIHCHNAARLFRKPIESIAADSIERYLAKKCVHALNYGMAARRLIEVINADADKTGVRLSLKEAELLVAAYHAEFPLVREWHSRIQAELARTRTLTNPYGRRRTFFDRWGDELFRKAYAFLPQSTVADCLNSALVRIAEGVEGFECLIQVHDAILGQCYISEARRIISGLRLHLELPIPGTDLSIPPDFKLGQNWGPKVERREKDGNVTVINPNGLVKWKEGMKLSA